MRGDTVIHFGGALKALDDKGKVGGYLVRFGNAAEKDAVGDYFTAETYFGPFDGNNQECLFHHGQPVTKGLEHLADHTFNPITTRKDEIGIWAETVLDMADDYERKVYELVKAGKLGWSSGSSPHRVKKLRDGKIVSWPICEGSLTPEPAEPRLKGGIIPLKSLSAATAKTMTTLGAGAALVPNPASPKKEVPMSRNTKADDQVCENQDCDNYGQSHANCQCHKAIKGDGSETDYEPEEESDENYPGNERPAGNVEKSDMVARDSGDYAVYEANREEVGATAGKTDYALYEANRFEVGVTDGGKAADDYGVYEANREELGVTAGKDDGGEIWGSNVGPVRVSLGLAKSLSETKSFLASVGIDPAETVKFLADLAKLPGVGETVKAGAKYHVARMQQMLKAFATPVIQKPAAKSKEDVELEAEWERMTPAEKAWVEKEVAEIGQMQKARLARQRVNDHHADRKARAAVLRRS